MPRGTKRTITQNASENEQFDLGDEKSVSKDTDMVGKSDNVNKVMVRSQKPSKQNSKDSKKTKLERSVKSAVVKPVSEKPEKQKVKKANKAAFDEDDQIVEMEVQGSDFESEVEHENFNKEAADTSDSEKSYGYMSELPRKTHNELKVYSTEQDGMTNLDDYTDYESHRSRKRRKL